MKLEKREITLNEYDSLHDIYQTEKNLLRSYIEYLDFIESKEVQRALIKGASSIADDMLGVLSLMRGSSIENE